jgi:DNA-binding PadR family transcriptional regulator
VLSEAELTLLGLTAEHPRYGYEIEHIIDERGLREWLSVGFSSVYYILARLEQQALISSHSETDFGGHPSRKTFRITAAGQGVLQTALTDLLRQPRVIGTGFELGLANLALLSPQQVYQALLHHQFELHRRIEATHAAWERARQRSENPSTALYTHALAIMEAERDWLASFLQNWKTDYPAVDTGQIPKVDLDDPHITQRHHQTQIKAGKRIQVLKRPKPDSQ